MSSDLAFLEPLTKPVVKVCLKTAEGHLDYEFEQGHEISTKVWPASVRLAQRLLLHSSEYGDVSAGCAETAAPSVTLELGCGKHALVSRALADSRKARQQSGPNRIYATDVAETVEAILNGQGKKLATDISVEYLRLDWTIEDDLESFCKAVPDVALITAADVLYRSEYMWAFAKVCSRVLRECGNEHSCCILSYQDRNNPNIKVFIESVAPAHGLSFSRIDLSQEERAVAREGRFTLSNNHLEFTHLLRLAISPDDPASKESTLFL